MQRVNNNTKKKKKKNRDNRYHKNENIRFNGKADLIKFSVELDVRIQKGVPCEWHVHKKADPKESGNNKDDPCNPSKSSSNQRHLSNYR